MNLHIPLNEKMIKEASKNEERVSHGHLGTHIDLKGKTFNDVTLKAHVFKIRDNETLRDKDLKDVEEGSFIIFNSGHIDEFSYGSREYQKDHAVLSDEVIEELIRRKVRLIGIDGPGIKWGKEHPLIDAYLAERDIFVVENLCNLDKLEEKKGYEVSIRIKDIIDDGCPVEIFLDEDV